MTTHSVSVPQALSAAVTVHNKQVVLHLSEPREYVAFSGLEPVHVGGKMLANAVEADPSMGQSVIDMSMTIIDAVYEARGDLKPAGGAVKQEMIERHRRTLTKRLELMLNSQRDKRKVTNPLLAKQMVEAMLNEVFA